MKKWKPVIVLLEISAVFGMGWMMHSQFNPPIVCPVPIEKVCPECKKPDWVIVDTKTGTIKCTGNGSPPANSVCPEIK